MIWHIGTESHSGMPFLISFPFVGEDSGGEKALTFESASPTRFVRAAMLEVIHQDFVTTARAKGLRECRTILGHVLRNALLPVVTVMAWEVPGIFTGITPDAWRRISRGGVPFSLLLDYRCYSSMSLPPSSSADSRPSYAAPADRL